MNELEQEQEVLKEEQAFEEAFSGEKEPEPMEAPEPTEAPVQLPPVDVAVAPTTQTLHLPQVPAPGTFDTVEFGKMQNRLRKSEGAVGGLKNQINDLNTTIKELQAARPSDLRNDELEKLRLDQEGLAKAIERNGEMVKDDILKSLGQTTFNPTEVLSQVDARLEERMSLIPVDIKHPGWRDTVKAGEFSAWLSTQGAGVRSLSSSEDPHNAIQLLDIYEDARRVQQNQTTETTNRLESAVAPINPAMAPPQPTTLTDEDEFEAAFKSG